MTTRGFVVSGRVQGVGFRWFVHQRANALGLLGYVRNLPGGRVEVVVAGPTSKLEQLERDLQQGPTFSRVSDVENIDISSEYDTFISFEII